jgi:hypothetical protein
LIGVIVPTTAKFAATVLAPVIATMQVGVLPAQAPDQPLKVEFALAVAVSVTDMPPAKFAVQSVPQLMPEGLDVTTPLPEPTVLTVKGASGTAATSKRAVTVLATSMVTLQLADEPVHAPDQPPKVEPDTIAAVSVTALLAAKFAVQTRPQSIPAGLEATLPEPLPVRLTVKVAFATVELKVAVTDCAALIVTLQVLIVPLQAPDHPPKLAPLLATAFSVTVDPAVKLAEQLVPQEIPAGVDVTVPAALPVPALVTVRVLFVVTTTFGLPM